jgi:hypothetical protein
MHTLRDLEAAFAGGTLVDRTMFITPHGRRGVRDKRAHSYSYAADGRYGFHSEFEALDGAADWQALIDRASPGRIDDRYAEHLIVDLLAAIRDAQPGRVPPRLHGDDALGTAGLVAAWRSLLEQISVACQRKKASV